MAMYDGKGTLASLLSLVVQEYEAERRRYWSEDESEKLLIQLMDGVASALLKGSSDLQPITQDIDGTEFGWKSVRVLGEQHELRAHALEKIEIDIAFDVVDETRQMAERALQLSGMVLEERPNERVLRFMNRLGRCFIAGFHPECVMLCRGVLENALKESLDRRGHPKILGVRKRLAAAEAAGWMSSEVVKDAEAVWERGNIAVHEDPFVTKDVVDTIERTLRVLTELYVTDRGDGQSVDHSA